jgi:hypothetical protein
MPRSVQLSPCEIGTPYPHLFVCRYYDLELPLFLKKGYFFEACQVQGHEHANVSKILPHLLIGLTSVELDVDLPMDLAIAWRLHQMTLAGVCTDI